MKNRCHNPSVKCFSDYGGRGIIVCERWRESFENFAADMGERPEGATLERIDNDGNYKPSNVRWASRAEQAVNKRSNRMLTDAAGNAKTLAAWARETGVTHTAILHRLQLGWSEHDAVTTPAPQDGVNPNSRLSENQVKAIRSDYPAKSGLELAALYGVSKPTIYNIVKRRIYKHI